MVIDMPTTVWKLLKACHLGSSQQGDIQTACKLATKGVCNDGSLTRVHDRALKNQVRMV